MTRRTTGVAPLAIALMLLLTPPFAAGQSGTSTAARSGGVGSTGDGDWELPTDPKVWRNSPPLSLDSLEGKGVVFFYFTTDEPPERRLPGGSRTRGLGAREDELSTEALWTYLNQESEAYVGKPVLFLGVASANDARSFERYLRRNRVQWPVIADPGGALTNAMGVPNLDPAGANSTAVKVLSAEGALRDGLTGDFQGTAELALEGAAWRVDPSTIPPRLNKAWRAIELGDFAAAAKQVTRAAKERDPELKAAAERLLKAVRDEAEPIASDAQEALQSSDSWSAYKHLDTLVTRFDGYDELIGIAADKLKELAEQEEVKKELAALTLFDKARAQDAKGTAAGTRRAKSTLQRLLEDHPGTEAASKAEEALAVLNAR